MTKPKTHKNPATLIKTGKKFWIGSVNVLDGQIEEVHTYQAAERNDFHHSYYFSIAQQEKMSDGVSVVFWIDQGGDIESAEDLPVKLTNQIHKQIKIQSQGLGTIFNVKRLRARIAAFQYFINHSYKKGVQPGFSEKTWTYALNAIRSGYWPDTVKIEGTTLERYIDTLVDQGNYSDSLMTDIELATYDTFFKMHPEKIAGKVEMTSSLAFPLATKGTTQDAIKVVREGIRNIPSVSPKMPVNAGSNKVKIARAKARALKLKLKLLEV
jgi:hypothetical protein